MNMEKESVMDEEQLQEIRERYKIVQWSQIKSDIDELITALAEAQVWKVRYLANNIKLRETRDEAAGKLIRTEESWNKTIDEVVALRAQLAEAQAEVVGRKESNKRYHKQMQGECYE